MHSDEEASVSENSLSVVLTEQTFASSQQEPPAVPENCGSLHDSLHNLQSTEAAPPPAPPSYTAYSVEDEEEAEKARGPIRASYDCNELVPELSVLFEELRVAKANTSGHHTILIKLKRMLLAHLDHRRHRLKKQTAALQRQSARSRRMTGCITMLVVSSSTMGVALESAVLAGGFSTCDYAGNEFQFQHLLPLALNSFNVISLSLLRFWGSRPDMNEAMVAEASMLQSSLTERRESIARLADYEALTRTYSEIEELSKKVGSFGVRWDNHQVTRSWRVWRCCC